MMATKTHKRTQPTMRVMRELDPGLVSGTNAYEILPQIRATDVTGHKARLLGQLRLEDIQLTLLADADRFFAEDKVPSRHKEASRAYGAPVYEVRDRDGAGWRGAVIVDDQGEPWLVYAAKHDEFHANVPTALKRTKSKGTYDKNQWEPLAADHAVRREQAKRLELRGRQKQLLESLREALREAHTSGSPVKTATPVDTASQQPATSAVNYTIAIEHDEPAASASEAHLSTSTITLTVDAVGGGPSMLNMLRTVGVVYVQPDSNFRDQDYAPDGSLNIYLIVSHAKLSQLLGDADVDETKLPPQATPPDKLHQIRADQHLDARITGSALKALCGAIFVPSETHETIDLPTCLRCEEIVPAAQSMLDAIAEQAAGD